jgi:hypothetical protein
MSNHNLESGQAKLDPERIAEKERDASLGFADAHKEKSEVMSEKTVVGARSENPSPEKNVNLVDWDGPDDPENPKNWAKGRKWAATLVC